MEFLVITGMSGAGKSRAINALEDIGFYCVDNIPPMLIPKFYELFIQTKIEHTKVALVTDSRSGDSFADYFDELEQSKREDFEYKVLFIDCSDEVLINRYKETRRKHPLAEKYNGSIEKAIEREREMLNSVRERADYLIDTTHLSVAQIKDRLCDIFLSEKSSALFIRCMSFAFKRGVPSEADLIFDVRCLPNPYYVDELREKTGLCSEVQRYVLDDESTDGFLKRLYDMIDYLIPLYTLEGKSQLVIAIGCTGGQHRSVTITQKLFEHILQNGARCAVTHRDINSNKDE